jgi:hypothetical protein
MLIRIISNEETLMNDGVTVSPARPEAADLRGEA